MSEDVGTLQEIKEDVKSILNILNGNGDVGLCAKVAIIWRASVFVVAGIVIALIRSFF